MPLPMYLLIQRHRGGESTLQTEEVERLTDRFKNINKQINCRENLLNLMSTHYYFHKEAGRPIRMVGHRERKKS